LEKKVARDFVGTTISVRNEMYLQVAFIFFLSSLFSSSFFYPFAFLFPFLLIFFPISKLLVEANAECFFNDKQKRAEVEEEGGGVSGLGYSRHQTVGSSQVTSAARQLSVGCNANQPCRRFRSSLIPFTPQPSTSNCVLFSYVSRLVSWAANVLAINQLASADCSSVYYLFNIPWPVFIVIFLFSFFLHQP
jgi:hypothetical protein